MLKYLVILVFTTSSFAPCAQAHAHAQMPKGEDACMICHGNQPVKVPSPAPELPHQFSASWNMYEVRTEKRPPYKSLPPDIVFIRGETHYDWSSRSMTEVYSGRCIDIFPGERKQACQFISKGSLTYFIEFHGSEPVETAATTCCRWRETEFWAPRPEVIKTMRSNLEVVAGPGSHWILDMELPGPFGFAFDNQGLPQHFWFPVRSGWVQQAFHQVKLAQPLPGAFQLPQACQVEQLGVCSF